MAEVGDWEEKYKNLFKENETLKNKIAELEEKLKKFLGDAAAEKAADAAEQAAEQATEEAAKAAKGPLDNVSSIKPSLPGF